MHCATGSIYLYHPVTKLEKLLQKEVNQRLRWGDIIPSPPADSSGLEMESTFSFFGIVPAFHAYKLWSLYVSKLLAKQEKEHWNSSTNSNNFSNNNSSFLSSPVVTHSFSCLSPQCFHLNTILPFLTNFYPTPFSLIHFPHRFCAPNHSSLCFCAFLSVANFALAPFTGLLVLTRSRIAIFHLLVLVLLAFSICPFLFPAVFWSSCFHQRTKPRWPSTDYRETAVWYPTLLL